ncbi:TetR/AcrR family transcriptional regulator [Dyadobacter sp. LHD-138]|uniref:TetR/AcrR family transcriptional regulator n=1 Tax=Dyadobacter sp. LHD-138 TaxID=3071413 RepID=UPI0027DF26CA|nr:TetR/AcrR family transcriptional regulator [Dyadobacter sp. LHD-138]MDQ6480013.1 TetR/AcrR family transcriptional regulator [Dyadobacter sp. LHD-138]
MARTKEFNEDLVLDKAVDLFWHKGYNRISAQEIVDGLGLSRSSLYDTYGDKRTLFIRALKRYRVRETGGMITLLDEAEDIKKVIRSIFQASAKDCSGTKLGMGCFIVNSGIELAPHDDEIADIIKEGRLAMEDGFGRALERGQEQGQISDRQSARAFGAFLVNNLWGLKTYGKSQPDKKVIEDTIEITLSVLEP